MKKNNQFRKNFIWNVLGTGINAFSFLFFVIIVTRVNGIEETGIFTLAYSTACILFVVGTYSGRVFQVTDNNKDISDKDYIISRIFLFFLMIVLGILFVAIRGYDFDKVIVFLLLIIYKGLEAISDVFFGIMQKNDYLDKVGKSYLAKSLLAIIVFGVVDILTKNIIITCVAIICVWLLLIFIYDIPNVIKLIKTKEKIKIKNVLIILKKGFFIFTISFLGIYILNAPKYAIDQALGNSEQAIFGILIMPATIIGLFGQFLVHPYLNQLSKLNSDGDYKSLQKIKRRIIAEIILFSLFCSALAYLFGIQFFNIIYGIDLQGYQNLLTLIIVSSALYNVGVIYSNILTTMRYTFVQFIIYIIVAIIAIIVSNSLTLSNGIEGACLAYFIIMMCICVIYCIVGNIVYKVKIREKIYE